MQWFVRVWAKLISQQKTSAQETSELMTRCHNVDVHTRGTTDHLKTSGEKAKAARVRRLRLMTKSLGLNKTA